MNDLKQKMQLIWGIFIVMFLALLFPYGWIVSLALMAVNTYLYVRYMRCPYCQMHLPIVQRPFCPHCGNQILD